MKILLNCIRFCFLLTFVLNLTLSSAQTIAAGDGHSLALCSDETVRSWGTNPSGQLGNGTQTGSNIPIEVSNLTDIIAVVTGENHSLALKNDGTVWTWGDNIEGQLGNGTTDDSSLPGQIENFTGVIAIAAGEYHSLALKNDGTVWAWGWNNSGQFGDGTDTDSNIPKLVSELSFIDVIAIAAGSEHSLFLRSNGQILACGNNSDGQLGNSNNSDSNVPVPVGVAFTDVTAIAASGGSSMLLKSNGIVFTWGDNFFGQLGDGSNTSSNFPVQVNSLTDITAIAAGDFLSLALRGNGSIMAWGRNLDGELGDGTNTSSNIPVAVSSVSNVFAITAGQRHSIALKNDGTVSSWGANSVGQLGNGTITNSNIPADITGLCTVVTAENEVSTSRLVSIFPNPSGGNFTLTIAGEGKLYHLEFYSIQGQMIYSTNKLMNHSINKIDLSEFSKGIYFLKIRDGEKSYIEKIVIQ